MTRVVGLIVEGHGEEQAAPILVRRLAEALGAGPVTCGRPFRVARGKLVQRGELERAVELVSRRTGPGAPILVLLDADDDCPASLGPQLAAWARQHRQDRTIEVVVANREYEAWFLAAAPSLAGQRGLPRALDGIAEPERPRSPKAWLNTRMPLGYTETIDQAALTAVMDLQQAAAAASFRKLARAMACLLEVPTPAYALRTPSEGA